MGPTAKWAGQREKVDQGWGARLGRRRKQWQLAAEGGSREQSRRRGGPEEADFPAGIRAD